MVQATQLRPGMVIIHEGDLFRVTAVHHLTPGNKRGFMQTKMKNLRTGIGTEYKFRSEDRVDQAILDNRQMQYLYAEGDLHTFMDTENYEQITLSAEEIGGLLSYLLPDSVVGIEFHDLIGRDIERFMDRPLAPVARPLPAGVPHRPWPGMADCSWSE